MKDFTEEEISEIIAMAWCDKTSFERIHDQFGIAEKQVKLLMRKQLKRSSYRLWRRRVYQRIEKHGALKDRKQRKLDAVQQELIRYTRFNIPQDDEEASLAELSRKKKRS